MTVFHFDDWVSARLQWVEHGLERWVAGAADGSIDVNAPVELAAAMRYAVLDGGKRLRPLLALAAYEALLNQPGSASAATVAPVAPVAPVAQSMQISESALRAACAVELIHAYSLVHDDMPCMDNDVLRRGKPTVHVQFGQAGALLAGDALQALAFELLTPDSSTITPSIAPHLQAQLMQILARASGLHGMAGGQAIDLASVGSPLSQHQLQHMHALKTGALLSASVMMGAHVGLAQRTKAPLLTNTPRAEDDVHALRELHSYSQAIGLAFQVIDDVLDVTADSITLGKTAGKDADNNKPTYVSILGLEASRQYAQDLHDQALQALANSGLPHTQALKALADRVIHRTS